MPVSELPVPEPNPGPQRGERFDVVVIGGGPAGMMAAGRAAERGARVALLEKNASLGHKLLITGGGRCNFTNAEPDTRVLASHYGKADRALLSPFSKFSSQDCLRFFAALGMKYKVEENNRAFPANDKATSVLNALVRYLEKGRVRVITNTTATGFLMESSHPDSPDTPPAIACVKTDGRVLTANAYILATGGVSHPETGSTGDGFRWLAELGHAVRYPEPSLVPVVVKEKWVQDLQGLSFPLVNLSAWAGRKLLSATGKLLFTHFGLSGPLILNLATELSDLRQKTSRQGELIMKLDFIPNTTAESLNKDFLDRCAATPGKKLKNAHAGLLPPRLLAKIVELSLADPEKSISQITRDERIRYLAMLKAFPLTFRTLKDESHAVVTSGGLALKDIDFRGMTSKRISNLAVTGDLLDINRPSGGYSLQLCWATARVAGEWAATRSGHLQDNSLNQTPSFRT